MWLRELFWCKTWMNSPYLRLIQWTDLLLDRLFTVQMSRKWPVGILSGRPKKYRLTRTWMHTSRTIIPMRYFWCYQWYSLDQVWYSLMFNIQYYIIFASAFFNIFTKSIYLAASAPLVTPELGGKYLFLTQMLFYINNILFFYFFA